MGGQPIVVGSAVHVTGQTQGNGVVLAERVALLPPGSTLPDVNHEQENESEDQAVPTLQSGQDSGRGFEDATPTAEATQAPESGQNDESWSDSSGNVTNDSNTKDSKHKNDNKDSTKDDDGSEGRDH